MSMLTCHWEIDNLVVIEGYQHSVAFAFYADDMVGAIVDNVRIHVLLAISVYNYMPIALKAKINCFSTAITQITLLTRTMNKSGEFWTQFWSFN